MSSNVPMNPPNHLDEVTGLLYVEGQLEAAAAREAVAHLEQCSSCRLLLDTLKRESLLLRQALVEEDEALPARLAAPRVSEGLSWGWLLAFGLSAAGVYTFWNVYVSPWIDNLQQSGFGGQFMFTWLVFNGASWKGWDAMLQFIIFASLAVLGAVLLFLFRRNLRRLSSFSIFLAALLLLALAHPQPARAAEFVKHDGNYEVSEGQTVKNDLFVFAASVRVAGTVDGDLYCFCSTLTIESGGHVTGDVIAFAHAVRVIGKVDGSLRTFSSEETIEGDVGRNVLSFVGVCQTTTRSHVAGSATLFVGDLELDGPLGRDLAAFIGAGNINAPIGGNVMLRQGQNEHERRYGPASDREAIQVGAQADIKGGFRYKGPIKPDISPQAHLAGAAQIQIITQPPWYNRPMNYWYNAMIWGTGFLVGLVLIALAPAFAQEATRQAGRIGVPLGLGLVMFIVMPVVGMLACITVVGLGLGVPLLFLWLFLIFFGQVIAAMWVGDAILGSGVGTWPLAGRLALGLFLIRLGALVPFVGFWVRFLACLLGFGAISLIIYRRLQPTAPLPPAMPLPAAPPAA
jgi:hypothetical protein